MPGQPDVSGQGLYGSARRGWWKLSAAWRRWSVFTRDAVLAVIAWVALLPLGLLNSQHLRDIPHFGPLWIVTTTILCAPLLVRTRFPIICALAMTAGLTIAGLLDLPAARGGGLVFIVLATTCSASYHRGGWWRLVLAGSTLTWILSGILSEPARTFEVSDLFFVVSTSATPIVLGYALRVQRDRSQELLRLRDADHRRAQAEERNRIAHEVHDTVGHHLSAIRLRAVGSRRALTGAPETGAAEDALTTIADISSTALNEIRQLLRVLREDADRTLEDQVPLTTVTAMAGRLAGNGLDIKVLTGEDTPPTIPLDAYRIVQESLTNVIRHASANTATVDISTHSADLILVITDDGSIRPGPDTNPFTAETGDLDSRHGLRSMAERVRRNGGDFRAAPIHPHGWQVRATLPAIQEANK